MMPLSAAERRQSAKVLLSTTKVSQTRIGTRRHWGQRPIPERRLLPSATASEARPLPWLFAELYELASKGLLSSSKKSQPAMSSTKPLPSSSVPSEKKAIRSSASSLVGSPCAPVLGGTIPA